MDDDETEKSKHEQIVQYYHDDYYGQTELFQSAFGWRPVIYCDWTASGKNLKCVETYIQKEVLTLYANTHTATSITGIQTSKFRTEARSIILKSLRGEIEQDAVVFCGSGVTGAIYKMANVLMKSPQFSPQSTVVFISVYEHNSNIFIWKEMGIKVVVIPEEQENEAQGHIDQRELERQLQHYSSSSELKQQYNLLIGSFSAASNVSGIVASIDAVTELLHKYGALSFWDFATAAPYLDINMTDAQNAMRSKDAVFIATHKFLSGPNSPGILCAKRKLFCNYVPVVPGGGTVFVAYGVNDGEWQYLENIEEKEEGGTPDIVGSIRASFAFLIKDQLTTHFIEQREDEYMAYFWSHTKELSNMQVMGNTKCRRLPIISFNVAHTSHTTNETKLLHYNFVAALMNDLFGVQGRGGCSCAGMYGLQCLNFEQDLMEHAMDQTRKHNELARPGYYRVNLHYTLTRAELEYVVSAVKFVCEHGWKFLVLYDVNAETGVYFHRELTQQPKLLADQLRSLLDVSFDEENGEMMWRQKHVAMDRSSLQAHLKDYIKMALSTLSGLNEKMKLSDDAFAAEKSIDDEERWYWLPSEIVKELNDQTGYVE
eukprot:CAMPEP_0202726112 /NCGR_PEP_ID=MMETSP1385-20130828/184446_1 /ASSEMBLY_ACC=CAM_ASM_000861 /TAXON_ID=933848 /ORGANISM="Elphidium margaritaceum" /LENGTH=598 /DNA_ID=CAMNT_0049392325 /DNA_START=712 /DNA_END=2508 /DNA_ORIENTATION=-